MHGINHNQPSIFANSIYTHQKVFKKKFGNVFTKIAKRNLTNDPS
jgi:hypothetical protein